MRTFIKVKTPSKSVKGTFHARYISERERDPGREEPESRPIFTHDRDGLKRTAADRYLAGGDKPNAARNEIQHLIIAFNARDARELRKLEIAADADAPAVEHARRGESAKVELSGESARFADSPGGRDRWRDEELAAAHRAQVARDCPYAEAVRGMIRNLEECAGLSDLRYVMAVHRHTDKTHVHLLLRRECADRETGDMRMLHRLPETFLNGRDEQGKAMGGLLDVALSDALDTMIPRRRRAARTESPIAAPARSEQQPGSRQPDHDEPPARETAPTPRRGDSQTGSKPDKPKPRFTTGRRAEADTRAEGHVCSPAHDPARPDASAGTPARDQLFPTTRPAPDAAFAAEPSLQTTPDHAPNLQNLTTGLQPNLQKLKIGAPEKPPPAIAYEEELKKIVAARFALDEQTKTAELLRQPGAPTKSQLTDSSSDAPKTMEQKKSQPSRGR
jgi:hypothetical protein